MSKQDLIAAIRQHNRTATPDFLVHFDEAALQTYLARLTTLNGQRGRDTGWVRTGAAPAVTERACV